MGIEPTSKAWEASILPLYDARSLVLLTLIIHNETPASTDQPRSACALSILLFLQQSVDLGDQLKQLARVRFLLRRHAQRQPADYRYNAPNFRCAVGRVFVAPAFQCGPVFVLSGASPAYAGRRIPLFTKLKKIYIN